MYETTPASVLSLNSVLVTQWQVVSCLLTCAVCLYVCVFAWYLYLYKDTHHGWHCGTTWAASQYGLPMSSCQPITPLKYAPRKRPMLLLWRNDMTRPFKPVGTVSQIVSVRASSESECTHGQLYLDLLALSWPNHLYGAWAVFSRQPTGRPQHKTKQQQKTKKAVTKVTRNPSDIGDRWFCDITARRSMIKTLSTEDRSVPILSQYDTTMAHLVTLPGCFKIHNSSRQHFAKKRNDMSNLTKEIWIAYRVNHFITCTCLLRVCIMQWLKSTLDF